MRILLGLAAVLLALWGAARSAQTDAPTVGLPTLSTTDGRFIGLPGPGLRTFVQPAKFWVGVAAGATTFEVQIFDGDLGNRWDLHDPLNSVKTQFRLYADPTKSGDPDDKPLIVSTTSDLMVDDAWQVLYTGPVHASALAGTGNYFYLLVVDWDRPVIAANEFNSFKIGAAGQVSITPGQWAFVGAPVNLDPANLDPALGTEGNKYDGNWDWYAYAPPGSTLLSVTECDADYRLDAGAPGDPPDDNPDAQVRVPPDVQYTVVGPTGELVINNLAPSGNSQCHTESAAIAQGGLFRWHWTGVDAHNTIFIDSQYEALPVPTPPLPANTPTPSPTPTTPPTLTPTPTVTPTPVVDLRIVEVTRDVKYFPAPFSAGSVGPLATGDYNIAYTIAYRNGGQTVADGVVVSDSLPSTATFLGPAGWTTVDESTYTFAVGHLTPGDHGVVELLIRTPPLELGESLVNTVRIADDGSHGADSLPGNNLYVDTWIWAGTPTPGPPPATRTPTATDTPTASPTATATPTATSTPAPTSVTLDPATGGRLTNSNGSVTVDVAGGAVTTTSTLVFWPAPAPTPFGGLAGIQAFDLEVVPQAQSLSTLAQTPFAFSSPISLSIRYDDAQLRGARPSSLVIAHLDNDGKWVTLPTGVDTGRRIAMASVGFAGRFALLASRFPFEVALPMVVRSP